MKKILHIHGMHCVSCEIVIRQKIEGAGYKQAIYSVSYKKRNIVLELKNDKDIKKIKESIEQAGYKVDLKIQKQESDKFWGWQKIGWIVFAGLLVFLLINTDISKIMPKYTDLTLGIALLIGLVASVSTCLAVTGGIVIGYAESITDKNPRKTQLLFHGGRILAFIVGGGLLGIVGGSFKATAGFSLVVNSIVGGILLYLGLQLLGFVPNISRRGIRLPVQIMNYISKIKNPKYAWLVGALTFFVPCGFTQSMQIIALQGGGFLQGAMMMGFFALGTLPVLLGLGLGTNYLKEKIRMVYPIIATLLVAFGIFTLFNGFQLIRSMKITNLYQENIQINEMSEAEIVEVAHDGRQFVPSTINLNQGKNYIIRVTPERNGIGCMYALSYGGKTYVIREGEVFDLLVDGSKKRNIPLVCASMGMRQGIIVIK